MTRTQNTGHCLRPPTEIIQNPGQVLTNVKCYNFCIKHCFYLKFGMVTLFMKWNQTKFIFSRFSEFSDFPRFSFFPGFPCFSGPEKSGKSDKLWKIQTFYESGIPLEYFYRNKTKNTLNSIIGILWYKWFLPENHPFWAYFNWLRHQNINFSKMWR